MEVLFLTFIIKNRPKGSNQKFIILHDAVVVLVGSHKGRSPSLQLVFTGIEKT